MNWRATGFLVVGGLGVMGTVAGTLGATSAVTADSFGAGGTTTSIFLALILVSAGVVAPQMQRLSARFTARRMFIAGQIGTSISWTIAGLVDSQVNSSLLILLLAAPIFGVFSGISLVLTPLVTRSYLGHRNVAESMSIRSVLSGGSAVLGGLLGGLLIESTQPAAGIIANGILTIPLAVFCMLVRPAKDIPPARRQTHSLRDALDAVKSNSSLRRLAVFVIGSTVLITPFASLVVPILNSIDHEPLPSGAGLVLAGIGAGRFLTPLIVKRSEARWTNLGASVWAASVAAGFLLIFSLSTLFPLTKFDLVVWVLVGFGFGSMRFTYRALVLGASSAALGEGREIEGVSVITTIGVFVAPAGLLAWGLLMDGFSSPLAVAVMALGMLGLAAVLRRGAKSTSVS